jgi:hypothetical protein
LQIAAFRPPVIAASAVNGSLPEPSTGAVADVALFSGVSADGTGTAGFA